MIMVAFCDRGLTPACNMQLSDYNFTSYEKIASSFTLPNTEDVL